MLRCPSECAIGLVQQNQVHNLGWPKKEERKKRKKKRKKNWHTQRAVYLLGIGLGRKGIEHISSHVALMSDTFPSVIFSPKVVVSVWPCTPPGGSLLNQQIDCIVKKKNEPKLWNFTSGSKSSRRNSACTTTCQRISQCVPRMRASPPSCHPHCRSSVAVKSTDCHCSHAVVPNTSPALISSCQSASENLTFGSSLCMIIRMETVQLLFWMGFIVVGLSLII